MILTNFLASQDFLPILRNPNAHNRVHNIRATYPYPKPDQSIPRPPDKFFEIRFIIIIPVYA